MRNIDLELSEEPFKTSKYTKQDTDLTNEVSMLSGSEREKRMAEIAKNDPLQAEKVKEIIELRRDVKRNFVEKGRASCRVKI